MKKSSKKSPFFQQAPQFASFNVPPSPFPGSEQYPQQPMAYTPPGYPVPQQQYHPGMAPRMPANGRQNYAVAGQMSQVFMHSELLSQLLNEYNQTMNPAFTNQPLPITNRLIAQLCHEFMVFKENAVNHEVNELIKKQNEDEQQNNANKVSSKIQLKEDGYDIERYAVGDIIRSSILELEDDIVIDHSRHRFFHSIGYLANEIDIYDNDLEVNLSKKQKSEVLSFLIDLLRVCHEAHKQSVNGVVTFNDYSHFITIIKNKSVLKHLLAIIPVLWIEFDWYDNNFKQVFIANVSRLYAIDFANELINKPDQGQDKERPAS